MCDLSLGEAKRGKPGGGMDLVAMVVLGLLGRGAVICQPVGFDDQAHVRPVEVDSEAVDPCLGSRAGQPGRPGDSQKAPLEHRVGEREGVAVEGGAEDGRPGRTTFSSAVRSCSGFASPRLSASLIAASSSLRRRVGAMSISVSTIVVTGMPR